jgi:hypothetical protein
MTLCEVDRMKIFGISLMPFHWGRLAKSVLLRFVCSFMQHTSLFKKTTDCMEEHLTSKRGIHVSDMLDHFYLIGNIRKSEFGHLRMKLMPTQTTSSCRKRYHKEALYIHMKKYFNAFEKNCPEGKFADLDDVSLYRHVGVNSDGLDLWIQLKGSV